MGVLRVDGMKKLPSPRLGGAVTTGAVVCLLLSRPAAPQPTMDVIAAPVVTPTATAVLGASLTLSGQATWYHWHVGEAAAGPRLRQALGVGWRGQSVTVCAGSCIRVRLTDWCACQPPTRLVDLDDRSFRQLAPLSAGVVKITITLGTVAPQPVFEPLPTGPATDTD